MSNLNKLLMTTVGAVFIALGTVGATQAVTLVVAPSAQTNVEGNVSVSGNGPFGFSQQRYQQVYAASEFGLLSEPQLITQISFRPNLDRLSPIQNGRPFSFTSANIQIDLSTTSKQPDALSLTWAENVGADNTVVYSRGTPLTISSANTSSNPSNPNAPRNFDINIPLQTPFLYNPATGNLLLDVRNFGNGSGSTTFFDVQNSLDSVSYVTFSGNPDSATAAGSNSRGLVTQFTTTPATAVPFEFSPGLGMLALGACGAISQLKSKMQKRKALKVASTLKG